MSTLHKDLSGANLHFSKLRTGTASPNGAVTPSIVGDAYFDTSAKLLYVANGLTNTSWIAQTGNATNTTGAPATTPTQIGQLAFDSANSQLYYAIGTSSSADWKTVAFSHSGNHTIALTTSANTALTLPTTGTLATLAGAESLTNKTITIADANLTIQDDGDATKQAKFQASGITAGQTRTLTIPDASTTIVGTDATQTLTNKTLDSTNTITGATAASLTNGGTVTLPSGTQTLISRTSTDTGSSRLQNKDLEDATTNFVDEGDTTKKLNIQLAGAANSTTTTIIASATGNRSITLPDATDTLLGRNTTDTVANKTLSNTTTINIKDTLLSIQDDGDATKQIRFEASGITAGQTRVLTAPDASTTIVGTDVAQVITLKDIDGGTASNTSRITLPSAAKTTLDALTRKTGTVVYDTTSGQPYYDNGSLLKTFGSQSSGGVNYLINSNVEWNFESGQSTGWATYADAAAVAPVDGTGGSPSVTFAASATAPLRNTYSGLLTKDAVNRQGQGVAVAFTLDNQDVGKPFFFSMDLSASANFTGLSGTESVRIYVYDVTNAALLPGYYDVAPGASTLKGFFLATSSTSYRFIYHISGTGASAWTLKTDTVVLGPQPQLNASAITDWQSFTPTGAWTANTTYTGMYRKIGDSIEVRVSIVLSGAPTAADLTVNLPTGFTVDTTKLPTATLAGYPVLGSATQFDSGTRRYVGAVVYGNTTSVYVLQSTTGNGVVDSTTPFTFGSADAVSINYTVPVTNASSNIQVADRAVEEFASNSSTTDADDTTLFVSGAAGSLVPTITATDTSGSRLKRVRFSTPIQPTDTIYIEVLDEGGVGTWKELSSSRHYKKQFVQSDGTQNTYGIGYQDVSGSSTDLDVRFGRAGLNSTGSGYASAGQSYPETGGDRWRIRKVSGGALVGFPLAQQNITTPAAVSAYRNNSQTATADTAVAVIFDTEIFDTGNQYSTSTGRFTAAVGGYYIVTYGMRIDTGATPATALTSAIQKNDAGTLVTLMTNRQSDLAASKSYHMSDSAVVRLEVNETIRIVITSSGQASTIDFGTSGQTVLTIAYLNA